MAIWVVMAIPLIMATLFSIMICNKYLVITGKRKMNMKGKIFPIIVMIFFLSYIMNREPSEVYDESGYVGEKKEVKEKACGTFACGPLTEKAYKILKKWKEEHNNSTEKTQKKKDEMSTWELFMGW